MISAPGGPDMRMASRPHETRPLNGRAAWLLLGLAAMAGALVASLPVREWGLLPDGLSPLSLAVLAINLGLAAYPWLAQTGRRFDFFHPLCFVSLLFLLVYFARPLQILHDPAARNKPMPFDPDLIQHEAVQPMVDNSPGQGF